MGKYEVCRKGEYQRIAHYGQFYTARGNMGKIGNMLQGGNNSQIGKYDAEKGISGYDTYREVVESRTFWTYNMTDRGILDI
jgi:hypothetical protein